MHFLKNGFYRGQMLVLPGGMPGTKHLAHTNRWPICCVTGMQEETAGSDLCCTERLRGSGYLKGKRSRMLSGIWRASDRSNHRGRNRGSYRSCDHKPRHGNRDRLCSSADRTAAGREKKRRNQDFYYLQTVMPWWKHERFWEKLCKEWRKYRKSSKPQKKLAFLKGLWYTTQMYEYGKIYANVQETKNGACS